MWGSTIVNLNDEATKGLTYILKNETTANGKFMDATETKGLAGKVEMVCCWFCFSRIRIMHPSSCIGANPIIAFIPILLFLLSINFLSNVLVIFFGHLLNNPQLL